MVGRIYAFRISNIDRYPQEFVPEPQLASDDKTLVLYQFDERTATVLRDASGKNFVGTITNPKWITSAAEPVR